jgi:precorrin-6B methylase 2
VFISRVSGLAARRALFFSVLFVGAALFSGCAGRNYGDDVFQLRRAAPGKDVIWIPSKVETAHAMLNAANVTAGDFVIDLGSGDGVIPIEAARQFAVRALGIEYNPDLVALSKRNTTRAGVEHLVSFKQGDIFLEDFSEATVLTLYLGESLNARLMPKILSMRPGTRVVSNTFRIDSWTPDREIRLSNGDIAYLWVVPALIDGIWRLSLSPDFQDSRLFIRQKKQFFDGYIDQHPNRRLMIEEAKLDGRNVRFRLLDQQGRVSLFSGSIENDHLKGHLTGAINSPVSARRVSHSSFQ